MLRSRFLWRLYAGYGVVILLAAVTVGILASQQVEQDVIAATRRSLDAEVRLLIHYETSGLADGGGPGLQERLVDLGAAADVRYTILSVDGQVLADSDRAPSDMDNHGQRPEVIQARDQGAGFAVRHSNTLGSALVYVAKPMVRDGEVVGYARAALPLGAVDDRQAELRSNIMVGASLAALAALIIGFLVTRQVTKPLVSMTSVASSMARGDYSQRVPTGARDEVGALARAFNVMSAELQSRMETITSDRNKLLTILSGMMEGVVAVDEDERVLHMNAVAARTLGVSASRSLGLRIWEVTRLPEIPRVLQRTIETGETVSSEARIVGPAQRRILEMEAAPLRDGEGKFTGAVVVFHDVTDLRRLEGIRQDFVANVSHELKTPITVIRGVAETLMDDADMPPATRGRFVEKIHHQSLRLSTLVSDLLTLARVESPGDGPEMTVVDLRRLVTACAGSIAPVDDSPQTPIVLELGGGGAQVKGDEEALQQVVSNLLDNAIKYTPSGGQIWARLRSEGDDVVFEVEDTGIGIEPENQARIFERFYRVDKARSREVGGTGLGLSIVKHICLAHGGEVTVASEPGRGSVFRIRLPRLA